MPAWQLARTSLVEAPRLAAALPAARDSANAFFRSLCCVPSTISHMNFTGRWYRHLPGPPPGPRRHLPAAPPAASPARLATSRLQRLETTAPRPRPPRHAPPLPPGACAAAHDSLRIEHYWVFSEASEAGAMLCLSLRCFALPRSWLSLRCFAPPCLHATVAANWDAQQVGRRAPQLPQRWHRDILTSSCPCRWRP